MPNSGQPGPDGCCAVLQSLFTGVTTVGFQVHDTQPFSVPLPKRAPLAFAQLLVVLELTFHCFCAGCDTFANVTAGLAVMLLTVGAPGLLLLWCP